MKSKGVVGLGRVVLAKRERPIILEPDDRGIRAVTLRYPYEMRKKDEYFADIPEMKIPGDMMKLAEHIVESKLADFEPDKFVDHYENAVVDLIRQKQAGNKISAKPSAVRPSNVVNLMDALRKSIGSDPKKAKAKAPPLVPAMTKGKTRARQRA